MRRTVTILALCLPLLLAAAESRPVLRAEVAYAKPMEFDYDRDGTHNRVQMWAEVRIDKGPEGYTGYLRRYMKDIDKNKPIMGYADINMLPNMPYGEKIPVEEVQKKGKVVLFRAGSKHYIFVDGGKGYANDTVIANDSVRDYLVELYDGDVVVY